MTDLLPEQTERGSYVYPDGSRIWPRLGYCLACWSDGSILTGDDDNNFYFETAVKAAEALSACDEGPSSIERILCDLCGEDWTDRPETGGLFGLGTKGICPDCAPRIIEQVEKTGEVSAIKAMCPPVISFADWVRTVLRPATNFR